MLYEEYEEYKEEIIPLETIKEETCIICGEHSANVTAGKCYACYREYYDRY